MPNEQNLMPIREVNSRRTPEQHSRDSRKGGIQSGISRRRKKTLREAAELYLSLPVSDRRRLARLIRDGVPLEDADNLMAIIAGLSTRAAQGDSKAAKVLFDLFGGQDARSAADQPEDDPVTRSLKEELEHGF